MRRPLLALVLATFVLGGCGGEGDPRAQLRDACDSLTETARANPSADVDQIRDLKIKVNGIADESRDSGTDTHEIAASLSLALDEGGTLAEVLIRANAACVQAFAEVQER